ncbi:MAG TPA: phosphoglucosamine mutase [Phycisphaerae bacterium]|nr:phosphoglucosamine mutase [Phycisphaerae bacterium]
MDELIVSVSGVRGIVGKSLTTQVAHEFGEAFGWMLQTDHKPDSGTDRIRAVIGRDSRSSGPMIQSAFASSLMQVGVDVTDLGIAATPTVALMGRFLKAHASIVITASHNPPEYNGIKFLNHQGMAFSAPEIDNLKKVVQEKKWILADGNKIGRANTDSRSHAHHVQTILAHMDAKPIIAHRYRVVLDSINGAGCIASPMLLGKLGVELVHVNGEASGNFAHMPEPTRENLPELGQQVKRKKAAIGFAQDPDADRLAIVDENGVYIGEEYTLALAVLNRLMTKHGLVVCNLSTSRMIDDIAAKHSSTVMRTPVGEANVAGLMLQKNALIGGEGNGGVIDLRIGPVRDSFIAMASILELMTRTGKPLSALVADIPSYAMIKTKFPATRDQAARLVHAVKITFADQKLDLQDGVRVDWPEGWVHVRPSNTESIARVIAEAADEKTAKDLIHRVEKLK